MELLKQLHEARMYRRLSSFDGATVSELSQILFEHLLALQILSQANPKAAAAYCREVFSQQQFDGFRASSPDLYNITTLLINAEKYRDHLRLDRTFTVPELQLRRVLKNIGDGRYDANDYSQMMLTLQFRCSGLPGYLVNLRRLVSDWNDLSRAEQQRQLPLLLQSMRTYRFDSDLFKLLERLA